MNYSIIKKNARKLFIGCQFRKNSASHKQGNKAATSKQQGQRSYLRQMSPAVKFEILSNLSLSKISKPIQYKRFRKHKNLIEANRANCNYTGTPLQKSREFKFGTSNAIFPRKKTLQF